LDTIAAHWDQLVTGALAAAAAGTFTGESTLAKPVGSLCNVTQP
jgi:hypothetical protein